jgi:HemY protein
LLESRLTQRVAALMARIEGEEHGDAGRVREWLARAVNAARDCAWTADGVVSDRWAPVSPVTGALDAFRWRVPVEAIDKPAGALLSAKLGALVGFAAAGEPALTHRAASSPTTAASGNANVEPIETPPAPADTGPATPAPTPVAAATTTKSRVVPVEPLDADDLKERIRLAAQRPIAASAAPAPAPERPAAANSVRATKPGTPRPPKTVEPKIFVSPRAPDDPGLEVDPKSRAADPGIELESSRARVAKA